MISSVYRLTQVKAIKDDSEYVFNVQRYRVRFENGEPMAVCNAAITTGSPYSFINFDVVAGPMKGVSATAKIDAEQFFSLLEGYDGDVNTVLFSLIYQICDRL